MIAEIKPYAEMKHSGVAWLGEVPAHWEVQPALAVYRPRQVKNVGLTEKTVLSLSYGRIVIKPEEKLRGLVPESFETYQIVEPSNIIIRTTDLQNDQKSLRIGHAKDRGIITSAYMCVETSDKVENEFGYQYLNAYDLLKIIYGYGSGLRQNLDFNDIKRMPVLVPPKDEQTAIVRFLDHADRRIRRAIAAKQKLIRLLEEQKQAIIHRALTRGLDPDVRLKPSGAEWLGDVPEHWEVRKLKWIAMFNPSRLEQPESPATAEIPFLPMERVGVDGRIDPEIRKLGEVSKGYTYFRRDDVVIAKITPCFENGKGACLHRLPADYGFGTTEFIVLRARSLILPQYLYLLTTLCSFRKLGVDAMTGSAGQQRVPLEFVKNFCVPIPSITEQRTLLGWVDEQLAILSGISESARREVSLLREYRTRLIADVVTGKLDVREAAAKLPESADPELPDDEALDMDGDEVSLDEAIAADAAA